MNISDRLHTFSSSAKQYQPTHAERAAAKLLLIDYFERCRQDAPTEVEARSLDLLVDYLKAPSSTHTLEKALALAKVIPNIKAVAVYIDRAKSSAPPQVRRAIEVILGEQPK
jgi:hypothetical protein